MKLRNARIATAVLLLTSAAVAQDPESTTIPSLDGSQVPPDGSWSGGGVWPDPTTDSSFSGDGATTGGFSGDTDTPYPATTMPPTFSSGSFDDGSDWWNGGEDEAGVVNAEIDIEGELAKKQPITYFFNATRGFHVSARSTPIEPGSCDYSFCVHIVFESDFGALYDFDAFVMDRYEARNPIKSTSFEEDGPMPMILGRMASSQKAQLGINESEWRWNETRRTVWTLGGSDHEIDWTMSLKQLYTLFPNYKDVEPLTAGPYYSDDISDQVIIRLTSALPSPYGSSVAMLPVIVNCTGSQLVDVNVTSMMLHPPPTAVANTSFDGSNELLVTVSLKRRRYGALPPWFQGQGMPICDHCSDLFPEPFSNCFEAKLGSVERLFVDLLAGNQSSIDLTPTGEACFLEIFRGDWLNTTTANAPPSSSASSSSSSSSWRAAGSTGSSSGDGSGSTGVPNVQIKSPVEVLKQTDAALRCFDESRCPFAGAGWKADGRVIDFNHQEAMTRIRFKEASYNFYLNLGLETSDGSLQTFTSQVIQSDASEEEIEAVLLAAIPGSDDLALDLNVTKYDNLQEINAVKLFNAWLIEMFENATRWSGSSGSATASGSTEFGGSTDGSNVVHSNTGSSTTSADGWPISGGSGSPESTTDPDQPPPLESQPPPPLDRRSRRRLSTSDGSFKPQPPTLMPVPQPLYTVEIVVNNITVTPHVLDVYASVPLEWSFQDQNLSFDVEPLDLKQLKYVLPPSHVDLSWHDPYANTEDSNSVIDSDHICGECQIYRWQCFSDVDCRFGVSTYLLDALKPNRFANRTETLDASWENPRTTYYRVDITKVLQDARAYFPSHGYELLVQLLSCYTTTAGRSSVCDISYTRYEEELSTGKSKQVPPVYLRATPMRIDVNLDRNALLNVKFRGMIYYYVEDGSVHSLQRFLEKTLFTDEYSPKVNASVERFNSTDGNSNRVSYRIVLSNFLGDIPVFWSSDGYSQATTRPWQLFIETKATWEWALAWDFKTGAPAPRIQWPYLVEKILNPEVMGGYSQSATTTNPQAICRQCAGEFLTCLRNSECAGVLRTKLASLEDSDALLRDPWTRQDEYSFMTDVSTQFTELRTGLSSSAGFQWANLVTCLSSHSCPVGYSDRASASTPSTSDTANSTGVWIASPQMPTVLRMQAKRTVTAANGLHLGIFSPDSLKWIAMEDVIAFLQNLERNQNLRITVAIEWDPAIGMDRVTFMAATAEILNALIIGVDGGAIGDLVDGAVWFESPRPVLPSWQNFFTWFDVPNTSTNSESSGSSSSSADVCFQCVPQFNACFRDAECWRSVSKVVLPLLQERGMLPISNTWRADSSNQIFDADFGSLLRNVVLMDGQPLQPFSTPESWDLFTDVLRCLDQSKCDLNYMAGAVTPPATAYLPTYLHISDTIIYAGLYVDSSVAIVYEGSEWTYTETGGGSVNSLVAFLDSTLGTKGIATSVSLSVDDDGMNRYAIQLLKYLGRLPNFNLVNSGRVGTQEPHVIPLPWKVVFESVVLEPQWPKLVDLFSLTAELPTPTPSPTPSSAVSYDCTQCVSELKTCYDDYMCQFALTKTLIPGLQQLIPDTYTDGFFQSDFTWLIRTQLFPAAENSATQQKIMRVLECSIRNSPCASAAGKVHLPFDTTQVTFPPSSLTLDVPLQAMMHIEYGDQKLALANDGDGMLLAERIQEWLHLQNPELQIVVSWSPTKVEALVATRFQIMMLNWYTYPLPVTMSGDDPLSDSRKPSRESTWWLVFQSSSHLLRSAFDPWIQWLSKQPSS